MSTGKFQRPRANTMHVDANQIQEMQRGYEARIARQAESIDRLLKMLEERTNDVHDHMTRANEAAAKVMDTVPAPALTTVVEDSGRFTGQLSDADLDELLKLIPPTWDLYNEDDTPRTILAAYIQHCTEDAGHVRAKHGLMVDKYQRPMEDLAKFLSGGKRSSELLAQMNAADAAIASIKALSRELANASYDARANAEIANETIRREESARTIDIGEIGDDTPPWGSSVAPVELERTAQIPPPITVAENETREVLSWPGAAELLPTDETRPGSF